MAASCSRRAASVSSPRAAPARRPQAPRRHADRAAAAVRRRQLAPAPAAASGRRSGPHADRHLRTALQSRPDRARAGPRRGGQAGVQPARSTCCSSRRTAARTEPRIREHFDRLVDRISTYEVQGAGRPATASPRRSTSRRRSTSCWRCRRRSARRPPTAGLKDAVQSDLQTGDHDIPIPLNQRVLAYIELFQGRLHDFIEEGMKRGSKYLPMIQNVFRAEGLPLDLAYVPLVESAFKPNALSRAKAKGVWQFMARHRRSRTACAATGTSTSGPIPKRRRSRRRSTCRRSARCSTATGTWRSRRTTAAPAACSAR